MAAQRTRATVTETGESPFTVSIEVGEYSFTGDEPVRFGGGGLGPNPVDLLTAALAECTAMTVRWFARQGKWPLDHVEVTVDHTKKVVAGGSVPVHVFDKTIILRGADLTAEQRARLLEIANKCPIQRILEGTPVISTRAGTPLDERFDQ